MTSVTAFFYYQNIANLDNRGKIQAKSTVILRLKVSGYDTQDIINDDGNPVIEVTCSCGKFLITNPAVGEWWISSEIGIDEQADSRDKAFEALEAMINFFTGPNPEFFAGLNHLA